EQSQLCWGAKTLEDPRAVSLQSTEALEFMKRDLAEFTQVVQHDTACTIAATASVVKDRLARAEGSGATEKVRKGLSDFLGVISDTFAPSPDKTIDCDVITLMATPSGTTEPYDSAKARLYSLQSDPATYCNEPDGPAELLEAWLAQFSLEEKKGEIAELLATSPSIRALYTKMVRAQNGNSSCGECCRKALSSQLLLPLLKHLSLLFCLPTEEFLGMSPLPCANITFPGAAQKAPTSEGSHPAAPKVPCGESWAVLGPGEQSPSESSESASLVTQIANPAPVPATQLQTAAPAPELSQRPGEATLEEQSSLPKPPEAAQPCAPGQPSAASSELAAGTEPRELQSKGQGRTETLREEAPTDLRVFELNSDSGKSTPSNNGKKG
ncbi:BSDC1 protein, partial [Emberiza fucata]|nr:BSDC1 protein [Emberiza fucata]